MAEAQLFIAIVPHPNKSDQGNITQVFDQSLYLPGFAYSEGNPLAEPAIA